MLAKHWLMDEPREELHAGYPERLLAKVPNVPGDGLFTICRITGDYDYQIAREFRDFGHVRPVEVLTPKGVSNDHDLVNANLRRSFRCQLRLWNITPYRASLDLILPEWTCAGGTDPRLHARGSCTTRHRR